MLFDIPFPVATLLGCHLAELSYVQRAVRTQSINRIPHVEDASPDLVPTPALGIADPKTNT